MTRDSLRNPDAITLTRLLNHLGATLSATSADSRHDPYERRKITANFEYARTLLLKLEHESANIKQPQQKADVQSVLRSKREIVRNLQIRLQELEQEETSFDDSEEDRESEAAGEFDSSDDEGEEQTRNTYAPAIAATANGNDTELSETAEAVHSITSAVRNRRAPNASDLNAVLAKVVESDPAIATATGSSTSSNTKSNTAARETLFKRNVAPQDSSTDRETILTAQRNEQEDLTAQILALATNLKTKAMETSGLIDSDKSVLEKAAAGLDKNIAGMDSAGRRMGTLRRMTEGKGWWGRIMLYAWISGLWLACFVIVFIGPKIRF